MSQYNKVFLAGTLIVLFVGVVLPYLVSSNDSLLTTIGILGTLGTLYVSGRIIVKAFKEN